MGLHPSLPPPCPGLVGIRAPFLTQCVPSLPSTDGLPLQPQLLLPSPPSPLGKGSLAPQPPPRSAWEREGEGQGKGLGGCAGAQAAGRAAAT